MKVKNIMFSGFMAVILMGVAGNASAAAVQIASKAYVDGELASKASNADLGAANEAIAQNAENIAKKADQTYVGTLPTGITATDIVGYIQEKTAGIATEGAMTELSGRVTAAEGKVTTLEGKMTTAEGDIDALESAMTGTGEGSVAAKITSALSGYATESYVGTQIQNATANMATDSEVEAAIDALSAEGGEIATLSATVATKADSSTVDGISGRVTELENADYQNANQVSSAITSAITGLDLANTYETKGEAAKVQANVDALSETVAGKAATSDVTALAGRVTTAEGKVTTLEGKMTTAESDIDTLQSEMDAVEAKAAANETAIGANTNAIAGKVAQDAYDTKMSALDAAIAAKFELPAGCTGEGANCVLSSIGGNIQWVDITAPLQ